MRQNCFFFFLVERMENDERKKNVSKRREGGEGSKTNLQKKSLFFLFPLTCQASTPPRLTSPVGPPKNAVLGRFSGRAAS
jgi:hypothetical protein